MEIEQHDLFPMLQFNPLSSLLEEEGLPAMVIIGCGKNKIKTKKAIKARDLYTSDRFQTACMIAEKIGSPMYILSGLHGLIKPEDKLSTYECNLEEESKESIELWREKILSEIYKNNTIKKICLLMDNFYAQEFIAAINSKKNTISIASPLDNLDEFSCHEWHRQALQAANRFHDLKILYALISKIRHSKKSFLLRDLSKIKLPQRGVYIFIDLKEKNFLGESGRIVRIGTHAVSEGSKSTLKNRLKNHLGHNDGTGNHRGSIFRLHVGRALIEKEKLTHRFKSWGEGQHAPNEIIESEKEHEKRVSEYLRELEVVILNIEDIPSKNSLRALVESQLIALCSENLQPIDSSTESWLGRYSPMESIVKSGLWNLRDVARKYEPKSAGSVNDIYFRELDQWHY